MDEKCKLGTLQIISVLEDHISHHNSKSAAEQTDLKPRKQIPDVNLAVIALLL